MQNPKGDTCQCCLLRTSYSHLQASMQFGKPNTYAEMLKECYGFKLQMYEKSKGICIICIKKLRDAYEFKLQVIASQSSLEHRYVTFHNSDENKKKIKDESNIDEEIENDDIVMDTLILLNDLKEEENTENNTNLPQIKSTESGGVSHLKSKIDIHTKKEFKTTDLKSRSSSLANKKKELQIKSNKDFIAQNDDNTIKRRSRGFYDILYERKKIKDNVNNIIKHTNCTPFRGKEIAGFVCYFCKNILIDLPDLKSHVSTEHGREKFIFEKDLRTPSFKMDITDLQCTLCNKPFDNIASVAQHLIDQHKLTFHKDVPNYIQEFKLPTDGVFQCALCNSKAETFKMLLQHMNSHYRNFICKICDAGFLNMNRLTSHKLVHNAKRFECFQCDKKFHTNQIRREHEGIHKGVKRKNWTCPYCNLEISEASYWNRNKHLLTEHNVMAGNYECNICERTFLMKYRLTRHIKKDHLLERNNKCPECDYSCFSEREMRMHMSKHTGERKYKCKICQKAYTRTCVLREHMRIHNNDRRHKCHVCACTFVQKCSLKSHLLSHHSMSLEENEQLNLDSK